MSRVVLFASALIVLSCVENKRTSDAHIFNIDSLINSQVNALNLGKRRLSKKATVDGQTTSVVLSPDSTGWADELAVFRQLNLIERPINRDRYILKEQPDPGSNLRIRSYEAQGTPLPPVPLIRFYYLEHPGDIRRIESSYSEANALYTSRRNLVMEFEVEGGSPSLRSYKVDGFQKIMMSDSVYFSIEGEVL